jgi:single-strand DNA-binding protein
LAVYLRDVNRVTLIGNLATDVELREIGTEKKVASFLLAVNRGDRDAGADFVWIAAWDRQAEVCAEFLTKGQRVGVDGRLRSHTWEKEGERRDRVEVAANRVEFLSAPNREAGAEVFPFEAATA